jgi:hypothetical protein
MRSLAWLVQFRNLKVYSLTYFRRDIGVGKWMSYAGATNWTFALDLYRKCCIVDFGIISLQRDRPTLI